MKKLNITLLAIATLLAFDTVQAQKSGPNVGTVASNNTDPGLDRSFMDMSVRPQDDFYNFVNGKWMKTAKIPSDRSRWGSSDQLRESTDNNAISILNSLLKDKFADGSEGKKI